MTGVVRLVFTGSLDEEATVGIDPDAVIPAGTASVEVDLGNVDFADSSAVGLLVRLHRRAEHVGATFTLVDVPPQVSHLMTITGLATYFDVERN